jgi:hypothetical protein
MTVHASEGVVSGFTTPSYAGTLNAKNELSAVWYIMAGTVLVDENGRIEVTAINSAERTIHCVLRGKMQGVETVDSGKWKVESRKIFRNGMIYIQRGEQLYDLTGKKMEN